MFAIFYRLLLDFAKFWPMFAGIPPELRVVSKLVKIKWDLMFGYKIDVMFMVNDLIFQRWQFNFLFNGIPSDPYSAVFPALPRGFEILCPGRVANYIRNVFLNRKKCAVRERHLSSAFAEAFGTKIHRKVVTTEKRSTLERSRLACLGFEGSRRWSSANKYASNQRLSGAENAEILPKVSLLCWILGRSRLSSVCGW